MRPDHRRGDTHAAGKVRRNDGIGAGLAHFLHVACFHATGNDADIGLELLGGNDNHQIARIIAGDGKNAFGILEVSRHQDIVVARITMQIEQAGILFLVLLQADIVFVDGDVVAVGCLQLMRNIPPDPAKTAEDVMPLELLDRLFHTFSLQSSIQIGFKQCNRHDREQHRQIAGPQNAKHYRQHAGGLIARHVDDFTKADCGDGDEGHVKAVKPRVLAIGQVHVAQGTEHVHRQQRRQCDIEQAKDITDLGCFDGGCHDMNLFDNRHGLGHENDGFPAIHIGVQGFDQRWADRSICIPFDNKIGAGTTGSVIQFDKQLKRSQRWNGNCRRHPLAQQFALSVEVAGRQNT